MKKKTDHIKEKVVNDEILLDDDEFFLFDEVEAYVNCDGVCRQKCVSDCMHVMPFVVSIS